MIINTESYEGKKYSEVFEKNKYVQVKNFLNSDLCAIATRYGTLQSQTKFFPEVGKNAQIPGTHSLYSDTLMEVLLEVSLPHIEKITGKKLFPTYSYYRVYKPGDELKKHKDRPSCEISGTLCLGYYFDDKNYSWPMFIEGTPLHSKPGDIVLYQGCEVEHWREPFDVNPGCYQVQVFLHYVDQNGPYPEYKFDKRQGLGYSKN